MTRIALATLVTCTMAAANPIAVPDRIDFGPVRIGDAVLDTLRLQNSDAHDLLITSASVPPPAFDLPNSPFSGDLLLSPGGSLDIAVRFAPTHPAHFSEQLQITSEASPVEIALEGEGVHEVVVINEVLADPAAGEAGDANGDGIRHSSEDEFVELLNTGFRAVDVAGLQLSDGNTSPDDRFTFPAGSLIGPNERIVLFGGGVAVGIPGLVYVDDGKIGKGLSNSGDSVYLIDPASEDTLARAAFGSEAGKDQSIVREPEGRGSFELHKGFPGTGDLFSPGRARVRLVGIETSTSDTSLEIGDRVPLSATGVFADSSRSPIGEHVSWTAVAAGVVTFSGGELHATGVGTVEVMATAAGIESPPVSITVSAPGISQLQISPSDTLVVVGDTAAFSAIADLGGGRYESIQSGVIWTSSDSGISNHIGQGRFVCVRHGIVSISSVLEEASAVAVLRSSRRGDLDADGVFGLVDAVRLVQLILGELPLTEYEAKSADLNGDYSTDIVDLTALIQHVLGVPAPKPTQAQPFALWRLEKGSLAVESNAPIRALEVGVNSDFDLQPNFDDGLGSIRQVGDGRYRMVLYSFEEGGLGLSVSLRLLPGVSEGERRINSVKAIDISGRRVSVSYDGPRMVFGLSARPNPFNASTVLSYGVPESGPVQLRVFSALGQEIARLVDAVLAPGAYTARWDGNDVSGAPVGSGIYLALLESGYRKDSIKIVLLQ